MLRGDRSSSSAFEIELFVESQAPNDVVQDLVRTAHAGCFAEASLIQPVPLTIQNTVNGKRSSS